HTENDPATVITSTLTVSDVDSANLTGATVTLSSGYHSAEDVLSFTDTATITGSWDSTTGVLTLSGTDTLAHYQAALRSVKYSNTSDNPSSATRTASFQVDDGSSVNNLSNVATRNITVTPVNDAPVLANIETPALGYTENDPATVITSTLTVSDVDSANLTGATVTLSSGYHSAEDVLSFTDTATITGSWDSTTGVLTLSGTDTLAHYQAALRSVKYSNTSDNPSSATRTASFQVDDGSSVNNLSNVATRNITVTPVNDAPVLTLSANSTRAQYSDSISPTVSVKAADL